MSEQNEIVIQPQTGWLPVNFRELWRFRELFYFLAWRDVKVKYKQAVLGIAWAVIQPLVTMAVFSVLFGRLAKMPSDGIPYPIFVFVGLLPWQYFAAVLTQSTNSVVGGAGMVNKIYFPRLIMPASKAIAALLDLCISSVVLVAMLIYYHVAVGVGILLLPLLVALTMMNAVGFGMWFAALNVRYRDIQHAIPFLVQVWMFVTPVIYPVSLVGEKYRWMLYLNPMAGVIESFRPAVFGNNPIPWQGLALSASVGFAVFLGGLFYFRRVERYFADVI